MQLSICRYVLSCVVITTLHLITDKPEVMSAMRKLKTIAAAIAVTIFSLALTAQTVRKSDVRILLADQSGNIIVQTDVLLVTPGGAEKKARTNDEGVAEFRGLDAGHYIIKVNVSGFKPYKSEMLSVAAGETKRLDIVMQLADIETSVNVDQNETVDMEGKGPNRELK
mgnify:CR=1 FL=1